MRIHITALSLISTVMLVGCAGPGEYFEPKTYGVRNSVWTKMSAADQSSMEIAFHEKLRLEDQLRLNDLMRKQNKLIAKAEHKNQVKQKSRLKEEHAHLKEEQAKNELVIECVGVGNQVKPEV